jgi:uncharacterized protein YcbX
MDNGQHYPPVAVTRARTDKPEELVRRVRNACAATVTRHDDTEPRPVSWTHRICGDGLRQHMARLIPPLGVRPSLLVTFRQAVDCVGATAPKFCWAVVG